MLGLSILVFVMVCTASIAIPGLRPMAVVIIIITAVALIAANIAFDLLIKRERERGNEFKKHAKLKNAEIAGERERVEKFVESELSRRSALEDGDCASEQKGDEDRGDEISEDEIIEIGSIGEK